MVRRKNKEKHITSTKLAKTECFRIVEDRVLYEHKL